MRPPVLSVLLLWTLSLGACNGLYTPPVSPQEKSEPAAWQAAHDWSADYPSWAAPLNPFNVINNVYYVGTKGLSSFLITSDDGHILIDGGLPGYESIILKNIEALGFAPSEVKILLNSHAHFDHSGGLAELKRITGAKFLASEGDVSALEGGFYLGAEDKPEYGAPPILVDKRIADGDGVKLGPIELTANITPGHSRGCTSWTYLTPYEGDLLEVLFFCSATVAGNRLIPPQYEGIVADYRYTFDKTREWKPDVFLSNHPSFFGMNQKRLKRMDGDPLAFVDRTGFPKMMERLEADFETKLTIAKKAASKN